jgi:hypothetical protein
MSEVGNAIVIVETVSATTAADGRSRRYDSGVVFFLCVD